MTRVFTGLRARRDHAVVARELPFDPQPPRDPPHGRMEPVQGTGHECQRLGQAIATGDVRELVQDDRAPAIAGPRLGNRGDQDRRPPDAERHRHRLLAASKQADLASNAHAARALGEQAAPLRVPDVARAARAPAHARALHEQRDQDDRDASRVHRADQRRPGEVEPARAGRRSVRIDGDRRRRARAGHGLVPPIDDRGGIGGLRRGANREGPARQGDRCHREQERAHEGETPDQMARGRRRASAQERSHTAGCAQQQRNLDHQQRRRGHGGIEKGRAHRSSPCSRTRFSRLLKRRYSASDSGVDVMSSSAAIADPVESSKKVRTSCLSADRLASSGFTAGK